MSPALFQLSEHIFDTATLRQQLLATKSGAYVSFEGWVRDHHAARTVTSLSYHAHPSLALSEGERVLKEALHRFGINDARCVHRVGALQVSELAVWVGVSAGHRDAAFAATRFIIDEIKARVPIWKHEHYLADAAQWLHENPASS
jgi:molybdopterin synthase catalytic subunit